MKCRPFQPGDIAIFQNIPVPLNFLNGQECEVLEGLREHHIICINGNEDFLPVYKVMFDNRICGVLPEQLRHKKDPESVIFEHDKATIGA